MRTRLSFPTFAILAAALLAVMSMIYRTHWRVAATEQFILTPWLGPAHLGDGKPASELLLCFPMGLAINREGELLIADRGRDRRGRVVWRIDGGGVAHIVAGTGRRGRTREGPAMDISFERPEGLAVSGDGSIFISDGFNHAVYRIDPGGYARRFAGTGSPGFAGDGGPASSAMLHRPADIRLDRTGNLFIADVRNHRVRKVDPSGRITTIAGTGEPGFSPDGTIAANAQIDTPWGLGLDLEDRLLIGDGANHRVRRIDDDGRLVTIAGSGRRGLDGDGGRATDASLNYPEALSIDPGGRLYIGDEWNNAVRVVGTDGNISAVIGTGIPGRAQIGGIARHSPVDDPEGVLATPDGLLISDGNNGRVIRVADDGIIHLVAGRGEVGPCATRW